MSTLHRISGCDNPARAADVVFIHGLGDDAFLAWQHPTHLDRNSWPYWFGEDHSNIGVWSLGYAASKSKWSRVRAWLSKDHRDAGRAMALPDRALDLLDLISLNGLGDRPLFFISHSLGGLVVKQILRHSSESSEVRKKAVFTNTRAVLFLATPHFGAALASLIDNFKLLFGSTVSIEDLRAHDANLRDLYNWYRNNSGTIQTATYYEGYPHRGITIVNPSSSHPGVGPDPIQLDEDHVSIAKPRDRTARVYLAASFILQNHVLKATPAPLLVSPLSPTPQPQVPSIVVNVTSPTGSSVGDLIPHELPPPAEQFFGRHRERAQLLERLKSGKNAAVIGAAGLGKTALAAEALVSVVGKTPLDLAHSPFPDGVVYLDLYRHKGTPEPVWNSLADKCKGPTFLDRRPARDRAEAACHGRRMLIVMEGGEEANGQNGRIGIAELMDVFSPQNRWLLLTRLNSQASATDSVVLKDNLHPNDAASLLNALTHGVIGNELSQRVLRLLEGHPLALTWAGNLLARGDEHPLRLIDDWERQKLPGLSDPTDAEHTLEWLFNRSVRGLDEIARSALSAAALLSPQPVPLDAIRAALPDSDEQSLRRALKALVQSSMLRCSADLDQWQFTHILGYSFSRKEAISEAGFKEGLSRWLCNHLEVALTAGADPDPASLERALQHVSSLLRSDNKQSLWLPLANPVLYEFRERLDSLGRLALQSLALSAVAGWMDLLPADAAQEPYWLRERSVLRNFQGDVLRTQGDLVGALAAYRESLKASQRLAAADPSNARWQRDLSVSQTNVGNVLRDQGDLAGALAAYRESLQVIQRLAAADPSNAGWQRDLSVSQDNVGNVLRDQGDLAGALAAYRESLQVSQRLAAADPSNAGWQRDLSVSLNNVGNVLRDQGDLAGALAAYRESLQVRQRLAAADPSNAGWQRDLSVSQDKVGNVLRDQGDLAGALAAYRESLQVSQRLAAADPSNAGWQRDLSVSQDKVGNVMRDQGDLAGALAAYRESLQVRQRLAAADPSNTGWQRDLSVSQDNVGNVLRDQGDLAGALAAYRESLQVSQRLAAADPSNAGWQRDLSVVSLNNVGDVLRDQGDLAGALAAYRESLQVSQRLAAADPSNAGWQRDLSVSLNKVGDVLRDQGDLAGALAAYRESLQVSQRLAAADPSNAGWQRDLSYSLTQIATLLESQGDLEEALKLARESLSINERLAAMDPSNATWRRDVDFSRALVSRLQC